MVITINNTPLDLPKDAELVKEAKSFVFSESLNAEYTTTVKVAKTPNNLKLLGVASMLDGSDGAYTTKIPVLAHFSLQFAQFEGYCRVEGYDDEGIDISLFLHTRPDGDLGRKINTIVLDDASTVFTGEDAVPTALPLQQTTPVQPLVTNAGYTIYPTVINGADTQLFSINPPFISVDGLLSRLSNALHYVIPATNAALYIGSTRRLCMPSNGKQVLRYRLELTQNIELLEGGVVVCNDVDGAVITYNRNTRITRIGLWVRAYGGQTNGTIHISNAGVAIVSHQFAAGNNNANMSHSVLTNPIAVLEDTSVAISITAGQGQGGVEFIVELDQEWDDVYETDFEKEMGWTVQHCAGDYGTLAYNSVRPMLEASRSGQQLLFPSSYYYNYYGAMVNLPDITLGELLTSVGWLIGKVPRWDGWQFRWENFGTVYSGDVMVDSAEPYAGELGKATTVGYKNDVFKVYRKDNEFLEDNVALHKSVFTCPSYGTSVAVDPGIYEGTQWKGDDVAPIAGVYASNSNVCSALPPLPNAMGADVAVPVRVKGVAKADLTGYDFVDFGTHRALVVSFNYDFMTGTSEWEGLLCRYPVILSLIPFTPKAVLAVPDSDVVKVTFTATADDVTEVPFIDIEVSDGSDKLTNQKVTAGDNVFYLKVTPSASLTVTVYDNSDHSRYKKTEIATGAATGGATVEVAGYITGTDTLTVGFSYLADMPDKATLYAYDEDGTQIGASSAFTPAQNGYLYAYDGSNDAVKLGTATGKTITFKAKTTNGVWSGECVIANPFHV